MALGGATRSLAVAAVCALLVAAPPASAQDVPVPYDLQADLLVRVAGYDRNLPARAGAQVNVLVLARRGDPDSAGAADRIAAALATRPAIGGLPHREEVVTFADAPALAEACRARHVAIVYLTPGFTSAETLAIGRALDGLDVLTVSAVPSHVRRGAVLGFDVVSGRARLLIDLLQAAKQRVNFTAEVLGLAVVFR